VGFNVLTGCTCPTGFSRPTNGPHDSKAVYQEIQTSKDEGQATNLSESDVEEISFLPEEIDDLCLDSGRWHILLNISLNETGKVKLKEATRRNKGRKVALAIGGHRLTVAVVREEITEGKFVVSISSRQEANRIAGTIGRKIGACKERPRASTASRLPTSTDVQDSGLPVYGDAKEIRHYAMLQEVVGATYKVNLAYPANPIVEFYDTKLKKRGFKPYAEKWYAYGYRKWQDFSTEIEEGAPYVWEYIAYWADEKQEKKILLDLRYYWYPPDSDEVPTAPFHPEDDHLNVVVQEMPFSVLPPPSWWKDKE
jgi:hypothetical protein